MNKWSWHEDYTQAVNYPRACVHQIEGGGP